jgi:uncharacterized SAM-binding protein YcdF (DUF218 family)
MTIYFILKLLTATLFPPLSLAIGVAFWLAFRLLQFRRIAATVLGIAVAETLILSFPPIGDALVAPLEDQARAAALSTPRCCFEAIVILGGSIVLPRLSGERPELIDTSDRIWEGARLWHAKVAPKIIVSGGSVEHELGLPGETEAEAMRFFLVDLGVPPDAIVLEDHSINTIENIYEVHRLVGDARVALVTSAAHMPRVLAIAAREGLSVSAFPSNFRAGNGVRKTLDEWLPSVSNLDTANTALKEIIALTFDWRRGGHKR